MGEKTCTISDLERFFNPRSVAVIGASSDPAKLGYKLVHNIRAGGFKGSIYPVNIKGGDVDGISSVPYIGDIKEDIDLAIISLPSSLVKDALKEVGIKGIPFAIIVSAGFKESGNRRGEEELVDIARRYGIRLLGPNVFGIIYTPSELNAQFGPGDVMKGRVAIITQSGALGAALMGKVFEEGIGVSGVVSTGNKADISDEELLGFFCSDPNTDAVLMYIEGLRDGRKFMEIVSNVSRVKPIIVVKSGTTDEGARAVRSHTASMAGSDRVFNGAFEQAGILRAPTIKDAIDWTRTLIDLPLPQHKNVLIITNGGGLGAIAVDWLTKAGIPLFKDQEWINRKLGPIFPSYATINNPVDITAQVPWDIYLKGLRRAMDEDRIGAVIGIYAPTSGADVPVFTKKMIETIGKPRKPVMICTFGGSTSMEQIQELKKHAIPAFYYPEEAVSSLAILYRYMEMSNFSPDLGKVQIISISKDLLEPDNTLKNGFIPPEKTFAYLRQAPFDLARHAFSKYPADLITAAEEIGYPVVLKVSDPDDIHKSESGGVIIDIRSKDDLLKEIDRLKRISNNLMVMEQVKGTELILGGLRDPVFGPVVMFGLGGILVEALDDVVFRVAPIEINEALRMIDSIKGSRVLDGFRGFPKIDRMEIARSLVYLGELMMADPRIEEIEINPLIANETGSTAVDARIRIGVG